MSEKELERILQEEQDEDIVWKLVKEFLEANGITILGGNDHDDKR